MDPSKPASSDLSKNDNKINEMKPMNSSQPSSRLLDSKNEDEIVKMKQKDFAQPSSKLVVGKKEDEITEMKPANDPIIEVKSHERQQIKQVKTSEDWFREMVETGVKVDLGEHPQLRRALVRKDWKEVERFISENPDTLYAKFTESCGTLFHSMANINEDEAHRLLDEFLDMISPLDLEETDTSGGTPLTSAAIVGNTKAAKILVKYNKNLPNMRNRIGQCPIHCAARSGHRETVEYLLSVTGVEEEDSHEKYSNPFAGECGLKLLEILIEFNFLDIACNLLKQYPKLARDKDHHRRIILQKLAKKPKGFASGSRPGYWNRFIYHCVNPVQIEYIHSPQTQKTDFYAPENVKGDAENPIQRPDSSTKSIALRMATTFGALSQKLHIVFWNALVHLAGRLVPSSEVAGAALQMQREMQWFKAVENLVRPSFQEMHNASNKTPREVFTETHKELVKEGEKWMKDTAQSCTVVVSLIITVVFAAAFTVPGGNNNEGIPNFLHDVPFIVFITSDALALFSSATSLLMFLGILTSRYAEEDFLVSLPRKLIIGLLSMFFSIAAMMVAFGATIYIALSQPWKWVIIPISLLAFIPVTLFALLQFPLLVEIFLSTYRPSLCRSFKYV
ncbi:ANK REP REGION domain-containing protein [Citrus sinensis]|nr:ANK REP REGION domain-containing protein [Citrus sinensis]